LAGVPGRSGFWPFGLQTLVYATGTDEEGAVAHREVAVEEFWQEAKSNDVREWPHTVCAKELADFGHVVRREAQQLIERVELKLEEDREEAVATDEVAPSEPAIRTCLTLAKRLAPHVALVSRLRTGAFTEDDGGISLVFQSLVTDRRIDCRIAADGASVSVLRIDERMQATSAPISLSDAEVPRELAEWVTRRA
jgi:hypothetical protein